MKRRMFLQSTVIGSSAIAFSSPTLSSASVSYNKLPRWRGFNLLEKFTLRQNSPYLESDFEWMADWGFDFVRLPSDYRCWTKEDKPYEYDEAILKQYDTAVEYGKQYGVHVNINLHRAPGYCVNPPEEKLNLWESEEAVKQFCAQWAMFAQRYKGIPNERVSFDLVNEPGQIEEAAYARVMRAAIDAIREVDPERLVIVDGLEWGRKPVMSLADAKIGQSTRGYDPMRISHHKANWINGSENWDTPGWPLKQQDQLWDKDRLYEEKVKPFLELEKQGCGVHVGEWGCYNKTPHDVALRWMTDFLSIWKQVGWGWSMWNFRGSFGVIDSDRNDIVYENFKGHKLDRKMLEMLLNDLAN
jgi:endoglucanase